MTGIHTGEGGLSSGEGKIKGENALFEYKKKYFSEMSKKDKKYIIMRHHAVLAFAYIRSNNVFLAFREACACFFISPKDCLSLLKERI